jgi:hypothetical protein
LKNQEGNFCDSDVRRYSEETLFNLIEKLEEPILFLAESLTYKKKIKEKYSNVVITEYDIIFIFVDREYLKSFLSIKTNEHLVGRDGLMVLSFYVTSFTANLSKY